METNTNPIFPLGTPTNRGFYLGVTSGRIPSHRFQTGAASFSEIPCLNIKALASVKQVEEVELKASMLTSQKSMQDFYEKNPHLA